MVGTLPPSLFELRRTSRFAHPTIPFEPGTLMPLIRFLVAAAASISLSSLAIAQPAPAPARPAPARPAAAPRPAVAPVPGQQPPAAAARAPRAAACHNGMSFDRFLTDLKQQAAAEGVSQRAL